MRGGGTPMPDLVAWLLEQIAADETAARTRTTSYHKRHDGMDDCAWTSARVLAECDAKRRIVEQYAPALDSDPDSVPLLTWILELLALPYADRPGYDPSWAPSGTMTP
jgi:hypothetical protein